MRTSVLPNEWFKLEAWQQVKEYLQWLPVPYSDRKQLLIFWSREANVRLTRYHYESIAQPGEEYTVGGTD